MFARRTCQTFDWWGGGCYDTVGPPWCSSMSPGHDLSQYCHLLGLQSPDTAVYTPGPHNNENMKILWGAGGRGGAKGVGGTIWQIPF